MSFVDCRVLGQSDFAVLVGSRRLVGLSVHDEIYREDFSRNFSVNVGIFAYNRVRSERNGEGAVVGKPPVENVSFVDCRVLGQSDFAVLVGSRGFVSFAVHDEVYGKYFSRNFSVNVDVLAYNRIRSEGNGESAVVGKPPVENVSFVCCRIFGQRNFSVLV